MIMEDLVGKFQAALPKPFREDSRMILRPTLRLIVFAIAAIAYCAPTFGFQASGEQILVTKQLRDIELIAGASQPLKFEYPIPKLLVQIPEVVDASAISANEILLTGLKPGISLLTVVDSSRQQPNADRLSQNRCSHSSAS